MIKWTLRSDCGDYEKRDGVLYNFQSSSSTAGEWEFQYLRCRLREEDQVGNVRKNISAVITDIPMRYLCGTSRENLNR